MIQWDEELSNHLQETLPKALRTQALTTLDSNFGLVWQIWFSKLGRLNLVWFGLAGLVW